MEHAKPRLSREDWLAAALGALEHEGIEGVRSERLARTLGVTTGSFYWHFRDRKDLLASLLDYWAQEMTLKLLPEIERISADPKQRLFALMTTITEQNLGRYEVPIRAWGMIDEMAAKKVQQIDQQRLAYIKKIFAQIGFRGRSLEMRARTLMYYQMAEPSVFLGDSMEEKKQFLKLRIDLLTQKQPPRSSQRAPVSSCKSG
jgi:AcrR family transcriptional regulator